MSGQIHVHMMNVLVGDTAVNGTHQVYGLMGAHQMNNQAGAKLRGHY